MIECYRDPHDWQRWREADTDAQRRRIMADPRYYSGNLYADMTARTVAEARDTLRRELAVDVMDHRIEMRHGIRLGSVKSVFTHRGTRKH